MIKLLVIYILCLFLFSLFDISLITNLITSVVDYVSSSAIGTAINNIFSKIGGLLDFLILDSENVMVTSTGIELGSLVWLGTVVRIAVVFLFIKLIIRLVI